MTQFRKIKTKRKKPICLENQHNWELIDGNGYDYKADYCRCKKCETRIPRQEMDL